MGYDVKKMAHGGRAQPVNVKGGRRTKTPSHDHSQPGADAIMARRAKNIEALLSPKQNLACNRKRKGIHQLPAVFASVEMLISMQLAAGDRAFHKGPRGPFIAEKRALRKRLIPRLICHLLLTGDHKNDKGSGNSPLKDSWKSIFGPLNAQRRKLLEDSTLP
jgi:hypothetical protein